MSSCQLKQKLFFCLIGLVFILSAIAGETESMHSITTECSEPHKVSDRLSLTTEEGYADGDSLTIRVNDIDVTFKILSIEEKTVQIGNGNEAAISVETTGALTIPSCITLDDSDYRVVGIADSAFINCNQLTSVEMPSSITASGENAFQDCSGLKKVIAPDLAAWCNISFANELSNPLYYANHFYSDENTEITDLVIPESVDIIGNYVFSGCTALTSVSLPESLKRIGNGVFSGCTALTEIILPKNLTGIDGKTGIGDYAFRRCTNLRKVTSNVLNPSKLGTDSFASIAANCELNIPIGTLSTYYSAGWTKKIFGGGVIEIGDVVENFCIENGVTAELINNVVYPDDDYSYTSITDYCTQTTSYKQDLPQPVIIESPIVYDGESLILETYTGDNMVRSDTFQVGQRVLEIWNLIPQTQYMYKLFVLDSEGNKNEIGSRDFRTEGQVRMMNIPEMHNFRDIGGWKTYLGKHVKYGKIYRSAELKNNWRFFINSKGIDELLNILNIGVEIDFGDIDGSPIEKKIEFVRGEDYQIVAYANGLKETKNQYKNCFEKTVNSLREGKNVLFHCSEGADRTGTFAFLLEGLLGVSESDLAKDYELTSLYLDSLYADNKRYRTKKGYLELINYVKSFPGNTINEKIEQMALDIGISPDDIKDFQLLMTDDDNDSGGEIQKCATPTISYANGEVTFNSETEGVTFIYDTDIEDEDITGGIGNKVQFSVTYHISAYATKEGYENSDVVTATLCWIDVEPRTEGISDEDAVTEVKALPVLIQTQGGTISVQGPDDGTMVSVYSADGKLYGSSVTNNGSATIATTLQPGSIAIVKIGEKSIKVAIK